MREEANERPRIAKAMHELEDAIHYLEATPHDFGDFEAQEPADSREAVVSPRRTPGCRAARDERCSR